MTRTPDPTSPLENLFAPVLELATARFAEMLGDRTPQAVREALQTAYAHVGAAFGQVPPVACKRGCSWCCQGVEVEITAPEAIAIAAHIRTSAPDLAPSVHAAAQRRASMNTADTARARERCPALNAQDECGLYDVRPFTCRAAHAVDATDCGTNLTSGDRLIRRFQPLDLMTSIPSIAMLNAMQQLGLDIRRFELATAVSLALNTEQIEEAWLSGEAIFDDAVRPAGSADPPAGSSPKIGDRS